MEIAALLRAVYCEAEVARGKPFKDPVIVDDNADAAYLGVVKKAFGGLRGERPLTGKVQFRGSKSDEMLQLADMVCGAIGDDDRSWYEIIAVRHVF